jgi:hypothetical protein
MALAQLAIGAHDPRWPSITVPSGPAVMTLFDNRSPEIVVLRRKGRPFSISPRKSGSRWQAALGLRAARTGCWGSGEVSGDAFD